MGGGGAQQERGGGDLRRGVRGQQGSDNVDIILGEVVTS